MSRNGPYATCGRCEHLSNGCCDQASETLRELGYPGVTIRPNETASASNCPYFNWSDEGNKVEREAWAQLKNDRLVGLSGRLTIEDVKPRR